MHLQPLTTWLIAFALAILIAGVAKHLRALSPSGVIAATVMGTTVVGTAGWWPGIILVTFFATSSLISKLAPTKDIGQQRGSQRDWVQVFANGWGCLVGCLLYSLTLDQIWIGFAFGSIAAATSDTWSSEIGRTSRTPPRLITSLEVVPPGTSGAISGRGILGAVAGALLIATLSTVASSVSYSGSMKASAALLIGLTAAGVVGSLLDSLLGATIQERRFCATCNKETEANPHRCGTVTDYSSGIPGFNNDVVNMCCVMAGGITGAASVIL